MVACAGCSHLSQGSDARDCRGPVDYIANTTSSEFSRVYFQERCSRYGCEGDHGGLGLFPFHIPSLLRESGLVEVTVRVRFFRRAVSATSRCHTHGIKSCVTLFSTFGEPPWHCLTAPDAWMLSGEPTRPAHWNAWRTVINPFGPGIRTPCASRVLGVARVGPRWLYLGTQTGEDVRSS